MLAGGIVFFLAFRERPTEGSLRSVAREYLTDWAGRRWERTYEREWFRYAPEVEVSLEEYAAYMDELWNERAPEDRRMRIVSVVVRPSGTGTVIAAEAPKRSAITDPGPLIERFPEDAAFIRKMTRPSVLELPMSWQYRRDDGRWVLLPTRATTDLAPWLDRILLQHNMPILADWPTIASWNRTGPARDLRFSIEKGMWCAMWSCEGGKLTSFSIRDTDDDLVTVGGGSAGKRRGRTALRTETGEFLLNAAADDECRYRIDIRAVDRLPQLPTGYERRDKDE